MKLFHKLAALAIPAVCLGLSSCGNSFEKTGDQLVSIETDLAQRMLDCETADDVSGIVKYIDEATAEIKELTAETKAEKTDLINEYKNLTGRELKELNEQEVEGQKAGALLKDGVQHMAKISGANMQTVGEACLKHAEAMMELGQLLNEIEAEAKK